MLSRAAPAIYSAAWGAPMRAATLLSSLCVLNGLRSMTPSHLPFSRKKCVAPFFRSFSAITANHNTMTTTESPEKTTLRLLDNIQGTEHATGGMYILGFTCSKCGTRSVRKFSKKSYHDGVVLIRCPQCRSLHLIADNLGWFGDARTNIETLMAEKGEEVLRAHVQDDLLSFDGSDASSS